MRVVPLVETGRLIVVGGVAHRAAILEQLNEIGVSAQVLLEPAARDSAAAMAAAAAWTLRQDPEAVNVFVASDHHIPDHEAFRHAARRAAEAADQTGRIVTLGVRPDRPSSAYGYIAPEGAGLAPVRAFVEKPDAETAERYIRQGYLWNSGNFIVQARTLIEELARNAPAVEQAVRAALPDSTDAVVVLGEAFLTAPKISIDYAVMETSQRASVLAVDFKWSDLGAWDAVAATGEGDLGAHLFEDVEGCLVRACDGVMIAAVGVRNLAIIAEKDAILVCDLSRSQDVKQVVKRLKAASPAHLDFPSEVEELLVESAVRLGDWLRLRALPLWASFADRPQGGFAELVSPAGRPVGSSLRPGAQAGLAQAFAAAGAQGWAGPWFSAASAGLGAARRAMAANLMANEAAHTEAMDCARLIAALAPVWVVLGDMDCERIAVALRNLIMDAPREIDRPTALLGRLAEASDVWAYISADDEWRLLADRCLDTTIARHFDAAGGFLRSHEKARPDQVSLRTAIEPGLQFQWTALLARIGHARGDAGHTDLARRLYAFGAAGVEARRRVVLDELGPDRQMQGRRARLWSQIEWMKAALRLAEISRDGERERLLADAASALRAMWRYLTPDGLWRDKLLETDTFIDEPAPARSLVAIVEGWSQLRATARALDLPGAERLTLT